MLFTALWQCQNLCNTVLATSGSHDGHEFEMFLFISALHALIEPRIHEPRISLVSTIQTKFILAL
jgi:hypothetical protein